MLLFTNFTMPKYNAYLAECVPKFLQSVLPNCLESESNASFLMLYYALISSVKAVLNVLLLKLTNHIKFYLLKAKQTTKFTFEWITHNYKFVICDIFYVIGLYFH